MRDLGEELGLLGSSLYSHVESKDQLLVEVVERGAALFQSLADGVTSSSAPPGEKLAALVRGHIAIITDNQDESATFLNEARFMPETARSAIVAMRDRYEATFRSIVEDGIDTGEFRPQNATLSSIMILSVLNALTRWYRPDGGRTSQEVAEAMVDFVMDGVQ